MPRSVFIVLLFTVLIFTGCKKKAATKNVEPGSYFPAYPGSFWLYSNGWYISVAPEYMKTCSNEAVPYITYTDGLFYGTQSYVKGYEMADQKCGDYYPFLRTVIGAMPTRGGYQQHYEAFSVTDLDTTVVAGSNIYDHCIAVYNGTLGTFYHWDYVDFFAPGTGLVRRDQLYTHMDSLGWYIDSTHVKFYCTKADIRR